MTKEQTVQLGIEFERRVSIIDPRLETIEKLDTDTIYSFLNQFQRKYVQELYLAENTVKQDNRIHQNVSDIVKQFIKHKLIDTTDNILTADSNTDIVTLPDDYARYVRSTSIITSSYKSENASGTTSNVAITQEEASKIINNFYNKGAIIKNPCVVMDTNTGSNICIQIIHDSYTTITGVDLIYYRYPYNFNVLDFNDTDKAVGAIHSFCELPYSCFDDVVEGAVNMFILDNRYKLQVKQPTEKQSQDQKDQQSE